MSRLFSRQRQREMDEADSIASRSLFFSPITQAPVISDMGDMEDWDNVERYSSLGTAVSEPMRRAIQNGGAISDLIKASPDEVIMVLRNHAVRKLGTFKMSDCDVLVAFGTSAMLTRGCETARDGNFEASWKKIIEDKVEKRAGKRLLAQGGWEEDVKLAAYVVNIKNASAGRDHGLLSPLVEKSQSGAASDEVWDFHAVRAVIEYKWDQWARKYLVIEFGLYLGWVICFTVFMLIYIGEGLESDLDDEDDGGTVLAINAAFFQTLTVLFMVPFVLIELKTFIHYRLRWFQMWNILDSAAYVLQIIISYGHLSGNYINSNSYNTLLAIQCVLLYVKVQYFARVFSEMASFVELLAQVMYRVRWFFVFIGLTMISVALAFAVLYKRDIEREPNETDEDFQNVLRSIVTTYAILLGDFESEYVFETTNRVVKGMFFLFFQVSMSITVLNLLIAVMTETYGAIMQDRKVMFNISRAQVMDELEVSLPKCWGPKLQPYCHFLIVEKKKDKPPELSEELSSPSTLFVQQNAIQKDVKELSSAVAELKSVVGSLVHKLEKKPEDGTPGAAATYPL